MTRETDKCAKRDKAHRQASTRLRGHFTLSFLLPLALFSSSAIEITYRVAAEEIDLDA
jgi:hypothetical protein